jgi:site-specific DNA-adenine methylase
MPFTGCGKVMNRLGYVKPVDEINNLVPVKEHWHLTECFTGVGAVLVAAVGAYYFWINTKINDYIDDHINSFKKICMTQS